MLTSKGGRGNKVTHKWCYACGVCLAVTEFSGTQLSVKESDKSRRCRTCIKVDRKATSVLEGQRTLFGVPVQPATGPSTAASSAPPPPPQPPPPPPPQAAKAAKAAMVVDQA